MKGKFNTFSTIKFTYWGNNIYQKYVVYLPFPIKDGNYISYHFHCGECPSFNEVI